MSFDVNKDCYGLEHVVPPRTDMISRRPLFSQVHQAASQRLRCLIRVIMCRADSFGMDDRTCLDGRSRNDIVVGVVAAPAIYI